MGSRFQSRLEGWKPRLRIISLGFIGLLLAASMWTVREELVVSLMDIARLVILFTIGAMLVGMLIGRLVSDDDRQVVVIACAVRNIPIAILIGSSVAMNPTFAGFVAGYFLIEVLIMIPYALWVRGKSRPVY
jgi:hypothetical protein